MGDQINHIASTNADARVVGEPSPLQKALEVFVDEWYFHDLKTSDAEAELNKLSRLSQEQEAYAESVEGA